MQIVIFSFLSVLAGFLIKFVDDAYDEKIYRLSLKESLAITFILGNLVGLAGMINYEIFLTVIAITVSVLAANKVDNLPFRILVSTIICLVPLRMFSLPKITYLTLPLLASAGWIDEIGNSLADKGKLKGLIGKLFYHKMFMEIIAWGLAIFKLIPLASAWYLLIFDITYQAMAAYGQKRKLKMYC